MKNENVISASLEVLSSSFDLKRQYWKTSSQIIDSVPFVFINRSIAEQDFAHKQLIPYALIHNRSGEVLCYQRHGSEKRLSDIYSVGIGGHVNDADTGDTLSQRLISGLRREIAEEIGLYLNDNRFEIVGMINEDETEVGHFHIGLVFNVVVSDERMSFDDEIGNPQWIKPKDIDISKFELWSALALKLFAE